MPKKGDAKATAAALARKKAQIKDKIRALNDKVKLTRATAADKCATAKLKAADKIEMIKFKIAELRSSTKKTKAVKWTPPFAGQWPGIH